MSHNVLSLKHATLRSINSSALRCHSGLNPMMTNVNHQYRKRLISTSRTTNISNSANISNDIMGTVKSKIHTFQQHKLPMFNTANAKQKAFASKRSFSSTAANMHGHVHKPKPGEELHVTFITKEGEQFTYEVAEGDSLLDIAQANNLDMEGACGGSCACSTCHVIVDPDFYDSIPEPDDDENDMLDLAFGLTETSRLGCQIKMSKEIDGIRVALPAMTRNLQTKDFNN